jgi:hypothetical protein
MSLFIYRSADTESRLLDSRLKSSVVNAIPELVRVITIQYGPLHSLPGVLSYTDIAQIFLDVSCSDPNSILTFSKAELYYKAREFWTYVYRIFSALVRNGGQPWEDISPGLISLCKEKFDEAIALFISNCDSKPEDLSREPFIARLIARDGLTRHEATKVWIVRIWNHMRSPVFRSDKVAYLVWSNQINDLCSGLIRSARGDDDTSEVSRDAIYKMREAILAEAGHIQV